ncbi:MAG TPA: SURF1 family protein [Propionibacteriaceae bacterium]|nr:SURF1 family protein [Propionibacteriaceae bacterium]
MRKLWLRWAALLVFVVILGAVFIRLGEWQLHRLEGRKESNAIVVANSAKPVKPWAQVFTHTISDADQWQRVQVTGTFDTANQLIARYRSNAGEKGSEIVTPLRTTTGQIILVNRGLLQHADSNPDPGAVPVPPSGEVTIVGFVHRNEQGKTAALAPVEGRVRLISSVEIGKAMGVDLVNGYVTVLEMTPPQSGDLAPIQPPELTEGPHLSYAIQWFCFTLIAVGGAVILIRADLRDRRKLREHTAARP